MRASDCLLERATEELVICPTWLAREEHPLRPTHNLSSMNDSSIWWNTREALTTTLCEGVLQFYNGW